MLFRIALFFSVALATAPLAAQTGNVISAQEWRETLSGVGTDDDDLLGLATTYSERSTASLNAGDRATGLHRSLISLVLSKHVHDRKERRGEQVGSAAVDSVNGLQSALVGAGILPSQMKQSAANLGLALRETSGAMAIKKRPTPRPATTAERTVMMALIKSQLIDPTSPIFGRADVVGNQACFTVNAKNRFGGYTGNREAVLYFDPKTKKWSGGGAISYPHGICLSTAN